MGRVSRTVEIASTREFSLVISWGYRLGLPGRSGLGLSEFVAGDTDFTCGARRISFLLAPVLNVPPFAPIWPASGTAPGALQTPV